MTRTSTSRPRVGLAVGLVAASLLTACSSAVPASTAAATPAGASSTASPVAPTPSPAGASPTATAAPTRPAPAVTSARPTARPSPTPTPRPTTAAPRPVVGCAVPAGTTAAQVVLVVGSGSRATIRACRRSGTGYVTDLGPYAGHVGINGVSWSKREGDLRTPAGVFPLRGGFGAMANPGLRIGSWLRVDASDVWVDDPGSALYNTHQRTPANGRWSSAEKLLNVPAYNYAQVIGYNEARVPGKGSAIFLHVDTGGGTAGCVSLPTGALLSVLRWERAGAVIAIR